MTLDTYIFFWSSTCFSFFSKKFIILRRSCCTRRPFSILNSSSACYRKKINLDHCTCLKWIQLFDYDKLKTRSRSMTSKVHASCLLLRFAQVNKQFTHGKLTFKMLTPDHLVQMHSATWLRKRHEYKCLYYAVSIWSKLSERYHRHMFYWWDYSMQFKATRTIFTIFSNLFNICNILMSLNASLKS